MFIGIASPAIVEMSAIRRLSGLSA